MKVTTPKEKAGYIDSLELVIAAFENELQKEEDGQSYYHLVMIGELNRPTCDEVERVYKEAGWDAKCRTSSENGERGGLTGLILQPKKIN